MLECTNFGGRTEERYLAPRVLHFGQQQLWWECQELGANEALDRTMPMHYNLKGKELDSASEIGDPKYDGIIRDWSQILSTYSKSSLTKAEDKLVAISGIAKHFQKRLGNDQYVAGLWRGCLAEQLLWKVARCTTYKLSQYRAPSFSVSDIS